MRPLVLALTVFAALLVACSPQTIPMTPEEAKRVDALTAKMTTRCVGRFLLDLPVDFVLNSQSSTEIDGVKIEVSPMEKVLFQQRLEGRLAQLERTKFRGSLQSAHFVRSRQSLPEPFFGVVIDRARNVDEGRLGRTLEALGWKSGFQIKASIDAMDNTFPEDANDSIAKQLRNDTPEKLTHLLDVYQRLQGRKDDEVPDKQGICFANGFLQGPPTEQEVVMIQHHLDNAPDVSTVFHSLSDLVQDDELLDRGKRIEAMLKETSGRTIRKGKSLSQIAGAQEWLMTKRSTDSGLMWQHMTLEANSKIGASKTPVVIFNLDSGTDIPRPAPTLEEAAVRKPLTKTTLSESQSVALWNKISSTLRPRPEAF
jgi:hypothetical protein